MAGFEIAADNGTVQVSADYYDATLASTQTVNGEVRTSKPFFAMRPTSATQYIAPAVELKEPLSVIRGVGKLYFFDFAMNPASTNSGIETYDENGKLTFSSRTLSLDIIDYIEIPDIFAFKGDLMFDKTYPSHVRPAVIPVNSPVWPIETGVNPWLWGAQTIGYSGSGSRIIGHSTKVHDAYFFKEVFKPWGRYSAYIIDVKSF